MCLGRMEKRRRDKIISTSVDFVPRTISECKNLRSERSDLKDRVDLEGGSFENLGENSPSPLQVHAPRGKCKRGGECRRRVPRKGGEGIARRDEGRRLSLARTRRADAKRRDGDGRNTCSGRVHAFQGFRENGEYDGGDVSLNISRGRDFKRTRVTALGRRLNNAKSTYSPAVPSRTGSVFLFFSFASFSSLRIFQPAFFSFLHLPLLHSSFSQSPTTFVARSFSLSIRQVLSRSLYPFSFRNLSYYRVVFCILRF